jgi:hypothetical protein
MLFIVISVFTEPMVKISGNVPAQTSHLKNNDRASIDFFGNRAYCWIEDWCHSLKVVVKSYDCLIEYSL